MAMRPSSLASDAPGEVGEALAVDLGMHEPGGEVVGRMGRGLAVGDHPVEVGGELGYHPGQAFAVVTVVSPVLGGVRALHDDVGPLGEPVMIFRVGAEEVCDHRGRDRRDVLGHEIAAATGEQAVEQLVAQLAREGLDPADAVLGDRRVDDAAKLGVTGFGDLDDELLLGRHHHAELAEAGLERVEVLRGREHVVIVGKEPCA